MVFYLSFFLNMKKILFLCAVILSSLIFTVQTSLVEARTYRTKSSDVKIKSYTTKKGKTVKSHYRSKSDKSVKNNYSCIDNWKCNKKRK